MLILEIVTLMLVSLWMKCQQHYLNVQCAIFQLLIQLEPPVPICIVGNASLTYNKKPKTAGCKKIFELSPHPPSAFQESSRFLTPSLWCQKIQLGP